MPRSPIPVPPLIDREARRSRDASGIPPRRPRLSALPPCAGRWRARAGPVFRSEEHTSELQSLMRISYAVFCLKKKKNFKNKPHTKTTDRHYHTRNHILPL